MIESLLRRALTSAVPLMDRWEKPSAFGGRGWHELTTSGHAGAHASCAALRLIAHPLFPIDDAIRTSRAESVVLHHLIPLFQGTSAQSEEAKNSTVKVASFVSACATLANQPALNLAFTRMLPMATQLAHELLRHNRNGCWGHWLGRDQGVAYRPTAAAMDALHRLSQVDPAIKVFCEKILNSCIETSTAAFLDQTTKPSKPPNVPDLWCRLPLLRALGTMVPPVIAEVPDDYEHILNAYISREVFSWQLTNTEDFQKYDSSGPAGTDYVSFNTTAYLVRSVLAFIRTGKVPRVFANWALPHLVTWAGCLDSDSMPTPLRFSFFHQTVNSLLEALEIHTQKHQPLLPGQPPMYVNPPIFQPHEFRLKPRQGFYITPFVNFPSGFTYTREEIESHVTSACATCWVSGKNFSLIPGDHNYVSKGIMSHIWQYINESAFVIALCVGAKPNVYYEIGMAHTIGKPVLLLGRKGHEAEDFTFDLAGIRHEALGKFDSDTVRPKVHKFLQDFFA